VLAGIFADVPAGGLALLEVETVVDEGPQLSWKTRNDRNIRRDERRRINFMS
jgi:hypothetical protein